MRAATVAQVLQDLFYVVLHVVLHVLLYLCSLLKIAAIYRQHSRRWLGGVVVRASDL